MVFDITHLKKIRRQLNITQHKFAKEAGISQSMVAKIESGRLDPTYSYVKKIEKAIGELTKQKGEKLAKDIMHKNIISLSKDQKIKDVAKLFTKYGISQAPVIDNQKLIGMVTEFSIMKHLEEAPHKNVEEIMEDSPPIISENTKLDVIISLLKFFPILIIQNKRELSGLITKADILKHI